jgi:hypothetical protein
VLFASVYPDIAFFLHAWAGRASASDFVDRFSLLQM